MKKTLIALLSLAGVAAAATPVQSGTITLDYTEAPKFVTEDATLYNYLYGTFNEGGTVTFALTLNWNGKSTSDFQTILHIGEEGKGLTLSVNGTKNLIFGEGTDGNNGCSAGNELTAATLEEGDNDVVFTLTYKEAGKATSSITLNDTVYNMPDMAWSDINMSTESARYDEYTLGFKGPGWDGKRTMVQVSTDSMLVTYKAIPEPTTATLSLLALAGLAARRRRK